MSAKLKKVNQEEYDKCRYYGYSIDNIITNFIEGECIITFR